MGNCMKLMTALLVLAGFVILYLFVYVIDLKSERDFYRNDALDWRNKALFWEGQYEIMADWFDAICHVTGFDPDESEEASE